MSSAQPATVPDKGQDKDKKGVGKLLSRVKTVLRKGDRAKGEKKGESSSRRFSIFGGKKSEAVEEKKPEVKKDDNVTKIPRSQLYEERAKHLAERFGLQLQAHEWYSTEGDALRTEKPIRMRVRRNCHQCNSTFGVAKECPNCQHVRCKQCTRYPPKRTEAEKQASRERRAAKAAELAANPPIAVDHRCGDMKEIKLTRPNKCGGPDLVYRKPRQRVRRTCHECKTLFTAGSKTCANCNHIRCTDCPRDPAKKKKYPFGYPGDEFGPNAIPRHECHKCKTMFPGGVADGTECASCKHPKCQECPRLKPRRVEPQPDPDVLKSVQEKLAKLNVCE